MNFSDKSKIMPNFESNLNDIFKAKQVLKNPDFSNWDLKNPNSQVVLEKFHRELKTPKSSSASFPTRGTGEISNYEIYDTKE